MSAIKFQFGNVVVVDQDKIGVIVKSWLGVRINHDVYVRSFNGIKNYNEDDIKYFIYSKELSDEEREFHS